MEGVWKVCGGCVYMCQSPLLIVGGVRTSTLIVKIEHKLC